MKKLISIILIVTMLLSTLLLAIPATALESAGDAIEGWVGNLVVSEGAQNSVSTQPPKATVEKNYVPFDANGNGELDDGAFPVSSATDFANMDGANKKYYLTQDITVTAQKGWLTENHEATFEFDGCGHTINYTGSNALFSGSGGAMKIKNLNVVGTVNVPASNISHAAGFVQHGAGKAGSEIVNVVVDVDVTINGTGASGCGLAGIWGKQDDYSLNFSDVHYVGTLTVNTHVCAGAGGLIGVSSTPVTVSGCTISGEIVINGHCNNRGAAGFIGYCSKKVIFQDYNGKHCVNNANVTLTEPMLETPTTDNSRGTRVGGFMGHCVALEFTNAVNNGNISVLNRNTAGASCVGGFVGQTENSAVFNGCVNNGKVTLSENREHINDNPSLAKVGGFVGYGKSTLTVNNSENKGDVSVLNRKIGGSTTVGGFLGGGGGNTAFTNAVNSGNIKVEATLTTERIGGFLGEVWGSNTTVIGGANKGNVSFTPINNATPSDICVGGIQGQDGSGTFSVSGGFVNSGNITVANCSSASVGGLLGKGNDNNININGAKNIGEIKYSGADYADVGGAVGYHKARTEISNFVNGGTVINWRTNEDRQDGSVGGVVGKLDAQTYTRITNCKNNGIVKNDNNVSQLHTGGIAGILLGANSGKLDIIVSGCTNTGRIEGGSKKSGCNTGIGGIIGLAQAGYNCTADNVYKVSECANYAEIRGGAESSNNEFSNSLYMGGIIGRVNALNVLNVEKCVNTGFINNYKAHGWGGAGGIIGGVTTIRQDWTWSGVDKIMLTIDDCHNYGTADGLVAAGILAYTVQVYESDSKITITDSTNNGTINGWNYGGGIVGAYDDDGGTTFTNVEVDNCINRGIVNGNAGTGKAGGIIGAALRSGSEFVSVIKNSANTGTVTGKGVSAGMCASSANAIAISGCANTATFADNANQICPSTGGTYSNNVYGADAATRVTAIETAVTNAMSDFTKAEKAKIDAANTAKNDKIYHIYTGDQYFALPDNGSVSKVLIMNDITLVDTHLNFSNVEIDGQNHTITFSGAQTMINWGANVQFKNMVLEGTINADTDHAAPLCRHGIDGNLLIDNVTSNVNINVVSTLSAVGGLIGKCGGSNNKIQNSSYNGTIIVNAEIGGGDWDAGGLIGRAGAVTITNCTMNGKFILGEGITAKSGVGGIAGWASGATIDNCSTTANAVIELKKNAVAGKSLGGIAGMASTSTIKNSTANAAIILGEGSKITSGFGGIVGGAINRDQTTATNITNCTNNTDIIVPANVNQAGNGLGGIAGLPYDFNISNCVNNGDITVTGNIGWGCVGGIAADNDNEGNITGCTNNGDITVNGGTTTTVAGIIANMNATGKVQNNVNKGDLTINGGNVYNVSGIIGRLQKSMTGDNILVGNGNEGDIILASPKVNCAGGIVSNYGAQNKTLGELVFSNCYNKGTLRTAKGVELEKNGDGSSRAYSIGGLIGSESDAGGLTFKGCYNEGDIVLESKSNFYRTGGFVGQSWNGTVTVQLGDEDEDTYNKGNITNNATTLGSDSIHGGVAGAVGGYLDVSNFVNYGNHISETGATYMYGGIVAYQKDGKTTIENCANRGDINISKANTCEIHIGGLIGYLSGSADIRNSSNQKAIMAGTEKYNAFNIKASSANIGGLVGCACGKGKIDIQTCSNQVEITTDGQCHVGGLVGQTYDIQVYVSNVENTGAILAKSPVNGAHKGVGGLIGCVNGNNNDIENVDYDTFIVNARNNAAVSIAPNFDEATAKRGVYDLHLGGLVGRVVASASFRLRYSENLGTITSDRGDVQENDENKIGWECIGGIVGGIMTRSEAADYAIELCSNEGNIISNGQVGGILGGTRQLSSADISMTIERCINSGDISSPESVEGHSLGGIAGNIGESGAVNTFWDLTIVNCLNYGDITGNGKTYATAGILANWGAQNTKNDLGEGNFTVARIENCANVGTVTNNSNPGRRGDSWRAAAGILANSAASAVEIVNNVNFGEIATNVEDFATFPIANCIEMRGGQNPTDYIFASGNLYAENSVSAYEYTFSKTGTDKEMVLLLQTFNEYLPIFDITVLASLIDSINDFDNPSKYAEITWNTLSSAVADAKVLYAAIIAGNTDGYVQKDVNEAAWLIVEATEGLYLKTDLFRPIENAIAKAEAEMAGNVYTTVTYNAYLAAVAKADRIKLEGVNANPAEIQIIVDEINAAFKALVLGGEIRCEEDFALLEGQAGTFVILADITINAPIDHFYGILNGNGHTIFLQGISAADLEEEQPEAALFNNLTGATIKNLVIKGNAPEAKTLFGKAAGEVKITDVKVELGQIKGAVFFGEVTDSADDNTFVYIKNADVTANVEGSAGFVEKANGEVAIMDSTLKDSAISGETVAGLVGESTGKVTIEKVILDNVDVIGQTKAAGMVGSAEELRINGAYHTGILDAEESNAITPAEGEKVEIKAAYAYVITLDGQLADESAIDKITNGQAAYEINEVFGETKLVQTIGVDAAPMLGKANSGNTNVVIKNEKNEYINAGSNITDGTPPAIVHPSAPQGPITDSLIVLIGKTEEIDADGYTAETWTALEEALDAAYEALSSDEQAEVNEAFNNLVVALSNLRKAEVVEEEVSDVDYTKLQAAITAAEALKEADYTSDSFANVQAILASAKSMLISKSQDAVDATAKALEDMMAALVKKAGATVVALDYTRLNAAIAKAEALKADEYTAASWAAVKAALDVAKAATTSTSQAVINSAAQALEINMIGLVKPVVTPIVTPDKPEDTTPEQPEDTTPEQPEDTTPEQPEDTTPEGSETQKPAGNGGCGSVIAGAAVVMAIVLTLGTGIVIKKKED